MAAIKTGKDITSANDIEILVAHLCLANTNYTQDELFVLAQQKMEGSKLKVHKRLKVLIEKITAFLVRHQLLTEENGVYYKREFRKEPIVHTML